VIDAHPSAQHNPTLPSFLVYISGAFRRSAFYFRKFPLALCAGADPENGKKSMMDMKDLPMEEGAEIKWARCEIKNALLAQIHRLLNPKNDDLPRQARDRHRKKLETRDDAFFAGSSFRSR
jgi:hypothetical protein